MSFWADLGDGILHTLGEAKQGVLYAADDAVGLITGKEGTIAKDKYGAVTLGDVVGETVPAKVVESVKNTLDETFNSEDFKAMFGNLKDVGKNLTDTLNNISQIPENITGIAKYALPVAGVAVLVVVIGGVAYISTQRDVKVTQSGVDIK